MSDYIKGEPTEKQKNFSEDIARYFGIPLPNEFTRELYSEFLDKYADAYKKSICEEMAYSEAVLDAIDARRDW